MRSPTIELLVVFAALFVLQLLSGLVGGGLAWFALSAPFARPWTLVTTVYAHASLSHLLANAFGLVVVGLALERFTTRRRFHAFVLVTGSVAAIAELLVGSLLGRSVAVLGASGAILALYGYVLAGNPLTGGLLDRLDLGRRAQLVVVAAIALAVTLLTAGTGVALVAHATGVVLGVVGGRLRVLDP